MIKVPDAAELKNPGRFYLQVGYNELFALGQAAWAGAQYYPQEKRKKKVDKAIDIIDNVGNNIKSLDNGENEVKVQSKGEEITNIVKYIVDEAAKEKVVIEKLWLDRIPDVIYIDELRKKYKYKIEKFNINPIYGEYDDPDNQKQGLLTLPISTGGNAIIFGAAGSGKEMALASIIYSSITTHTEKELNYYILDFGAETLTMFKNAPQVGEVLLSSETEKINNLFKLLNDTLEERKKLFVDYNGSYDFYVKHGGKEIPMIVVIINNIEAFLETYPDQEETLGQLTRDSLKYGIAFILSTNGPNTVRYRLRQNFAQNIVLQFNDPSDYSSVLPGVRKKQPSKAYGRGLINLDGIFEFQTAYSYKEEKQAEYIKTVCTKLQDICQGKARRIPILPEIVDTESVSEYIGDLNQIPVGIEKDTLKVATINMNTNYMYLVTGEDVTQNENFINGLQNNFLSIPNSKVVLLDALSTISPLVSDNLLYDSGMCSQGLEDLKNIYNDKIDKKDNSTVIVTLIGPHLLLNKMTPEDKTKLTTMLEEAIKLQSIKFIIVDTIDNIKQLAYEKWFKTGMSLSDGVWLGNGISNQFTLKVTTSSRVLREDVPEEFGYIISKGKASLMKLMSDQKNHE